MSIAPDSIEAPLPAASSAARRFKRSQLIHDADGGGLAWRVVSGVVRFDTVDASGGAVAFAGLAMNGDIVGAETLIFGRYSFRATALTPCELAPWPGPAQTDRDSLLRALALAERRAARVVALRSGHAIERIRRLIGLLLPQPCATAASTELPSLRDMADITSLAIETVSRTLSRLRRQKLIEPEQQHRGRGRKSFRISVELFPAA
ncbi:MAG: helix-turn-helix domain-containing protein [Sulfuritalea sp.]|jgi:CRP/FNR family nitrogen fixation transcriptional regulator|nr:helix-turn-helix domain-containing protein [Sulfuritalea sp.]MDP1981500.1 helix-turn-helix domain-containing protein [Sulfuritalea sp.]